MDKDQNYFACIHPGFASADSKTFTLEKDPRSAAYIDMENDCPKQYFMGGCQGGRSIKFLLACELLYQNVLQDQQNGITAVWHDESHWNRFLHHRSDVKYLSENFCSREEENRAEEDISIFLPSKYLQIGPAFWRVSINYSKKQPRIILKVRGGLGNQIWQYIGALALYGEHIDNKKKISVCLS